MDSNKELINQIIKVVNKLKEGNLDLNDYGLLPWVIILVAIIIIIIYLIRIEVNSNGKNWEINKCSSKYVFFSEFLKNNGDGKTANDTFTECVKRFL